MKSWFARCMVMVLVCGSLGGKITLEDIQGTWTGTVEPKILNVLTDTGPFLFCTEDLPSDCKQQIPIATENYTFVGSTLMTEFTHLPGVTSKEASAERLPACAKSGFYPVQSIFNVYDQKILSYSKHKTQIVFRRDLPDSVVSCQSFRHHYDEKGKLYFSVKHNVRFTGTPEQLVQAGLPYKCKNPPKKCNIKITEAGLLSFHYLDTFNLSCFSGSCLYSTQPQISQTSASLVY